MDAVWIKVFVLTLSECVAPVGKTVCQEHEIEMQFLTEVECTAALEQLVALKDQFENIIVNRRKSGCAPSARETEMFASLEEAKAASDSDSWHDPDAKRTAATAATVRHSARLENLASCEDVSGRAPCKMGDIIIEGASSGKQVEVWRSDR